MQTPTLHILAEFGSFTLQLSWQAFAGKCLTSLETIGADRILMHAFTSNHKSKPDVSKSLQVLEDQLKGHLIPSLID